MAVLIIFPVILQIVINPRMLSIGQQGQTLQDGHFRHGFRSTQCINALWTQKNTQETQMIQVSESDASDETANKSGVSSCVVRWKPDLSK